MTEETKDNSLAKRTREEIVREIEDTDKQVGEETRRTQETENTQWSQQCASEARKLRGRVTAFSETCDNVEQLFSEIDRLRQESSSAMPGAWPEIAVKLSQLKVRVDEHVKSVESIKEAHKRLEETPPDWVESLWNAAPGLKEDFDALNARVLSFVTACAQVSPTQDIVKSSQGADPTEESPSGVSEWGEMLEGNEWASDETAHV